jgi:hypothetical protein
LSVGGATRIAEVWSALDALDDRNGLVTSCRHIRRHQARVILSEGRLPFGAEPGIAHTCRYGDGCLRVTSDYHLPRGTAVSRFVAGCVRLVGEWTQVRVLVGDANTPLSWLPAEELPARGDCRVWHGQPLAAALTAADGTTLEIGLGTDLWRWARGLGHGPDGSTLQLRCDDDGVVLERIVLAAAEAFTPQIRTYRFSWYAAWTVPPAPAPTGDIVSVPISDRGDIDTGALTQTLADAGKAVQLDLDLSSIPVPASCRRSSDDAPCWAAAGTVKRMKRACRQLASIETHPFTVVISGLTPGLCCHGSHLSRRGDRLHWDLTAQQAFGLWASGCLGEGRVTRAAATPAVSQAEHALFRMAEGVGDGP